MLELELGVERGRVVAWCVSGFLIFATFMVFALGAALTADILKYVWLGLLVVDLVASLLLMLFGYSTEAACVLGAALCTLVGAYGAALIPPDWTVAAALIGLVDIVLFAFALKLRKVRRRAPPRFA